MGQRADAAAKLDGVFRCLKDGFHCGAINRLAFECAVEINHMQPFETLLLKRAGLSCGIFIVDGCRVHFAQFEPHALAVLEVYCGKQDHVRASI